MTRLTVSTGLVAATLILAGCGGGDSEPVSVAENDSKSPGGAQERPSAPTESADTESAEQGQPDEPPDEAPAGAEDRADGQQDQQAGQARASAGGPQQQSPSQGPPQGQRAGGGYPGRPSAGSSGPPRGYPGAPQGQGRPQGGPPSGGVPSGYPGSRAQGGYPGAPQGQAPSRQGPPQGAGYPGRPPDVGGPPRGYPADGGPPQGYAQGGYPGRSGGDSGRPSSPDQGRLGPQQSSLLQNTLGIEKVAPEDIESRGDAFGAFSQILMKRIRERIAEKKGQQAEAGGRRQSAPYSGQGPGGFPGSNQSGYGAPPSQYPSSSGGRPGSAPPGAGRPGSQGYGSPSQGYGPPGQGYGSPGGYGPPGTQRGSRSQGSGSPQGPPRGGPGYGSPQGRGSRGAQRPGASAAGQSRPSAGSRPPSGSRRNTSSDDQQQQTSSAGKEQQPAWTMDVEKMAFPDSPAAGEIHGKAFKLDRAVFNGTVSTLTLRQGEDFFPDRAVTIFLFLDDGATPEGKSIRVSPQDSSGGGKPHVHMKWKKAGQNGTETEIFSSKYAMKLEFGRARDGAFPGKIYLCLPDESKSVVAGTFTAKPK